jgi:hypothetical protein
MSGPDPQALLEADLRARRDSLQPSLAKATWQLVLGEVDDSLETLRTADRETAADREAGDRVDVLGLLVGDRDGARRRAAAALDRSRTAWAAGWRQYQSAMLSLTAGRDELAGDHVRELEEYAATHDRIPSGPPTSVAGIPAGILAADAGRASAGLDAYLAWHLRSARARSIHFNSTTGVVCLDAIVALLIARGRGLTLTVDPRYRRASVPILAIMINEWDGRPLDRMAQLSLETDLVAGAWLAPLGLDLGPLPPSGTATSRERRRPARRATDVEPEAVVDFLRQEIARGHGSRWQLASWSMMVGDHVGARDYLQEAIAQARRAWTTTQPNAGGILRHLLRSQEVANPSLVREHFGLALAAGDQRGLEEAGRLLRAWMDAVEEDERRQGRTLHPAYGHVAGYLDYIADMLGPKGPRAAADRVSSLPRYLHAACIGLERRDASLIEGAIDTCLEEHARELERKTSPPAPLCLPAIQLAAAADRARIPVTINAKWAVHPVPISLREGPGSTVRVGRLPTDLMGRAVLASAHG